MDHVSHMICYAMYRIIDYKVIGEMRVDVELW